MITRINDPKNIVSCKCTCKSTGRKCDLNKKWNNNKYQCECKKPIKKIMYGKKIVLGIIVHVFVGVINIVRLMNV